MLFLLGLTLGRHLTPSASHDTLPCGRGSDIAATESYFIVLLTTGPPGESVLPDPDRVSVITEPLPL